MVGQPILLKNSPAGILQPTIIGGLEDSMYTSTALRLGERVAVGPGGMALPYTTQEPVAGIVGEGELKPTSDYKYEVKYFSSYKLALIVTWSREIEKLDPMRQSEVIKKKIGSAIGRGMDQVIFHGINPTTGARVANLTALTDTKNAVKIDNSNIVQTFTDGWDLVTDNGADYTGNVLDPRIKSKVITATTTIGTPQFGQAFDLTSDVSSVMGVPSIYSHAVSGKFKNVPGAEDTGIRGFGGDLSSLKIGIADEITLSTSTEATVDGVSMFQNNMTAALCEVWFSFGIPDVNDFVKYEDVLTKKAGK